MVLMVMLPPRETPTLCLLVVLVAVVEVEPLQLLIITQPTKLCTKTIMPITLLMRVLPCFKNWNFSTE
jgi:hypothetical protein